MVVHALFSGVAKSLTEDEIPQENHPTASHSANLKGVVGTEKLWGQPPLASRVVSKRLAGLSVSPFR
jgi:hypothetical protein